MSDRRLTDAEIAVLGPEVKPSPEFVRKVADERFATEAEARAYIEHQCWKAALAAVLPST